MKKIWRFVDGKIFGAIDAVVEGAVNFTGRLMRGVVNLLLAAGIAAVILFLIATCVMLGWKIIKWAWQ